MMSILRRFWMVFLVIGAGSLPAFAQEGAAPAAAPAVSPAAHHFIFVRPDPGPPHPFFDEFEAAMRASVVDLGDTLEVRYANTDHYRMIEIIQEIAAAAEKPDAVIFMAMRNNGQQALEILNEAKVPAFMVNAGLTEEQYTAMGEPRTSLPYWLGEMLPDDNGAGYALAKALYEKALAANPALAGQGVNVLAIEANAGDAASVHRMEGLQRFAAEEKNFHLLQAVKGKWEKGKAYELTLHMLARHPRIDVIWAASDAMAIGAAQAAKEKGLSIGKDVFIGGVDWSQEGFDALENGTLSASAGGHILEGAWAAVVLHDYFNGQDFAEKEGLRMSSPMLVADGATLPSIRSKMGLRNWDKNDFTLYSRHYHPDIPTYNFSIVPAE